MIFCPHVPQQKIEVMEREYPEYIKKWVIEVGCNHCTPWTSEIGPAAKYHFEINGVTEETIREAQDKALITFEKMSELLHRINHVQQGVAA